MPPFGQFLLRAFNLYAARIGFRDKKSKINFCAN
jgi:hypothetical protein